MKGIEETPRRAWLRVAFLVIAAGLILIGIFIFMETMVMNKKSLCPKLRV